MECLHHSQRTKNTFVHLTKANPILPWVKKTFHNFSQDGTKRILVSIKFESFWIIMIYCWCIAEFKAVRQRFDNMQWTNLSSFNVGFLILIWMQNQWGPFFFSGEIKISWVILNDMREGIASFLGWDYTSAHKCRIVDWSLYRLALFES